MIVKVQLSQFTMHERQRVLIYNKSRYARWEGDASHEIIAAMHGEPKAFFHARVVGGEIVLDKRAPWQEW